MDKPLTPTQDLVMEVLFARTRLGHTLWTFDRNHATTKAANELQTLGYISVMHGMVPHTFRAELTEHAIKKFMSNAYTAPILGGPR